MSSLKTTVTFSCHSECSGLENYPASSAVSISFDGEDCNIYTYVEQFRCFLKACGFADKNIKDTLGEV